jgi:Fe2+ transport system protein FeoA
LSSKLEFEGLKMDGTTSTLTLDQLTPDTVAAVVALSSDGLNRRRMMDLGILPGARIEIEMSSPLGDPVAYRVRGSVVALRKEQARQIQITVEHEHASHQQRTR